MDIYEQLIQEVKKASRIIIFHHVAPDGDSLGSAIAVKNAVEQLKNIETVDIVITNYVPEIYRFLPDVDKFKKTDNMTLYDSYDLAIAVDCASKERLGDATELFNNAKRTVCIDHHITNTGFADIDLIEIGASATGEIVYNLIQKMDVDITPTIAINLYTAILTDTGGFKFENTKPETLRICASLIEKGANPVDIYRNCYEIKPLGMVKLQAKVVHEANFIEDDRIAYGVITRDLLDESEATDDYIDGITETLRQIKGIEVALVFKETLRKSTKVSLRSNRVDVCRIASYFGGGGHKLAAGCLIEDNIETAITEMLTIVVKQLGKADKNQIYS